MKKMKLILNESLISNKDSDIIEDTSVAQKPDYQIIDITVIPDEDYYPTIQSILIDLDEGNNLMESENSKLDINILSETVNQKTGYSNSLFEFESSNHTITLSLVLQETDKRGIYKVEAYTTRGIKTFESTTYKPRKLIESYLNSIANEYLIDKPLKESEEQLWCVQDMTHPDFSDKGYQVTMYGDLIVFTDKGEAEKYVDYLQSIGSSSKYSVVNATNFDRDRMAIFNNFQDFKKSLKESDLKVGDEIEFYSTGYKPNGKFSNKPDVLMKTTITKINPDGSVSAKDPQGVKSFDYITPEEIISVNGKKIKEGEEIEDGSVYKLTISKDENSGPQTVWRFNTREAAEKEEEFFKSSGLYTRIDEEKITRSKEDIQKRIDEIENEIQKKVKRYSSAQKQYHGDNSLSDRLEGEVDSLEQEQKRLRALLGEAEEDILKDDVKEDLAIEPGSDEEQMLDEIYEEPEEDKYYGAEDTYEDATYEKTEPDDYSVEEFMIAQKLSDEVMNLNIDYSNWNESSQEERFELVRPEIEKFVNEHKNEFDKDPKLFDLLQYDLTDANFHTEAKVMRDLYRGGK